MDFRKFIELQSTTAFECAAFDGTTLRLHDPKSIIKRSCQYHPRTFSQVNFTGGDDTDIFADAVCTKSFFEHCGLNVKLGQRFFHLKKKRFA
jgi:hypothetical protein